jgi:hypothetical protein
MTGAAAPENVETPFVHTDADGARLRHEFFSTPASEPMCFACGKPKNDHRTPENVECHICHNDPDKYRLCSAAHPPPPGYVGPSRFTTPESVEEPT